MNRDAEVINDYTALCELNEAIDQLAGCKELSSEADTCLNLAWWFTEEAIRERGIECSSDRHVALPGYCVCCAHFRSLSARAKALRSRL